MRDIWHWSRAAVPVPQRAQGGHGESRTSLSYALLLNFLVILAAYDTRLDFSAQGS